LLRQFPFLENIADTLCSFLLRRLPRKKFIFNDTTADQRRGFLAGKAFWLSGVLGGGQPVWMLDPRDAQYLNTSEDELRSAAGALVSEGLIQNSADAAYALATQKLMDRADAYRAELQKTLDFIKPAFNEQMRSGLTNM